MNTDWDHACNLIKTGVFTYAMYLDGVGMRWSALGDLLLWEDIRENVSSTDRPPRDCRRAFRVYN